MIAAATSIAARVRASAAWLLLLAVAAAGAWLYVQWQHARADAAALTAWADVTCAAAGSTFPEQVTATIAPDGSAEPLVPGERCRRRVTQLAAFERQVDQRSAETLAAAMRDRDEKASADAEAARRAAEDTRDAAERMESADAEAARRNAVDRDWFAALNNLAGLRGADAR